MNEAAYSTAQLQQQHERQPLNHPEKASFSVLHLLSHVGSYEMSLEKGQPASGAFE